MPRALARLAAAAVALLLLVLPSEAGRVFVLVHGAWAGEWYWNPVVAGLEARGERAVAVTLKGHGLRRAENGPGVSLADHVADVAAAIRDTGSDEVVLVAHSYGGRPATGAWDVERAHVARVVYIEAVAPLTDDTVAIPAEKNALAWLAINAPQVVDAGLFPVPRDLPPDMRTLAVPQSLKALYGEVVLTNGPLPDIPRLYVVATRSQAPIFAEMAARLARDPRWKIETIEGGHDVVRDAAPALVDLLAGLD